MAGLFCMRVLSVVLLCLAFSWATAQSGPSVQNSPTVASLERSPTKVGVASGYVLAPGDAISVQVFGEPELSSEISVGESGRIAFPLIGDLKVAGLRTRQVEKLITDRLKKGFLVDPKVNVTMRSYRSIFINGQVKSPGSFPYEPGLTVRKAISKAGGFTERASQRRIFVIDGSKGEQGNGRKTKLDDQVQPGDIITVEESFF